MTRSVTPTPMEESRPNRQSPLAYRYPPKREESTARAAKTDVIPTEVEESLRHCKLQPANCKLWR
jgi:hypothetical protein